LLETSIRRSRKPLCVLLAYREFDANRASQNHASEPRDKGPIAAGSAEGLSCAGEAIRAGGSDRGIRPSPGDDQSNDKDEGPEQQQGSSKEGGETPALVHGQSPDEIRRSDPDQQSECEAKYVRDIVDHGGDPIGHIRTHGSDVDETQPRKRRFAGLLECRRRDSTPDTRTMIRPCERLDVGSPKMGRRRGAEMYNVVSGASGGVARRGRRARSLLAGGVIAAAVGLTGTPAQGYYMPLVRPLEWSGPFAIDPGHPITGISCPSRTLCVATDDNGGVMTSSEPSAGPSAWSRADVDGTEALTGVSCASASLCVALDEVGDALIATDPTGGVGAWTNTLIDVREGSRSVSGISCVAGPLCVVSDTAGNVVVSHDPTGGVGAWTRISIDAAHSLTGVSCASTALCVAANDAGEVLSSIAPSAGGSWVGADVNGGAPVRGIACGPGPVCVAGASPRQGESVKSVLESSDPQAGAGSWSDTTPPVGAGSLNVELTSCVAGPLCVGIADSSNDGLSETTDPAAGAGTWASDNPDIELLGAVACADRSLCVIGDRKGNIATSLEALPLAVTLAGAGEGSVTSSVIACHFATCSHPIPPGGIIGAPLTGISCANTIGPATGGGICEFQFPAGLGETLTASPATGSRFGGWGGACLGSMPACTLAITGSEAVTATFTQPPKITGLTETARTWQRGASGARRRRPEGTTFAFELNVPASVKLAFTKTSPGRRIRGHCVTPTRRLAKRASCTRRQAVGELTIGAHAGINRMRFVGRISRHHLLAVGNYILTAIAASETSTPSPLRFTIVRG
jgi:Divergent InlB B-repeat domain